jgi:hypothetical protein
MSRETTAGVGRWRDGRPSRSGNSRTRLTTKKWVGGAILSTLFAAALVTVGWLLFQFIFPDKLHAQFVPFLISDYQKPAVPPLPWVAADRSAIGQAKIFAEADQGAQPSEALTLQVATERLARLEHLENKGAVVAYVAAHALVDSSGAVQIVVADSDPYATKTLLPLADVLTSLKKCPVQKKLLVLDLMSRTGDPLVLSGTSDGVTDAIHAQLSVPDGAGAPRDPNLWVLLACSPGESALWSERLGQSVFGYFFRQAFSDPDADTLTVSNAVTVEELAAYLVKNVDHWARQHRGLRQRPILIGKAQDFALGVIDAKRETAKLKESRPEKIAAKDGDGVGDQAAEKDKAGDPKKGAEVAKKAGEEPTKVADKESSKPPEPEGAVYPEWLTGFWKLRDEWQKSGDYGTAPRAFRRLEGLLLRAEARWRSGEESQNLHDAVAAKVGELTAEITQARSIERPAVRSVGQSRALKRPVDPALLTALKELLKARRTPELPSVTPDEAKKKSDTQKAAFVESLKTGKTGLDLGAAIVEALAEEPFDPKTVEFLDSIVSQSSLGRDVIELRLLHQLALRATLGDWNDESMQRIWDTVVLAEEVNNRPSTIGWGRVLLDDADAQRHQAMVLLLPQAYGFVSPSQVKDAWELTRKKIAFIDACQKKVRATQDVLDRARSTLVAYVSYLDAASSVEREASLWLDAARSAQEIDALLTTYGSSSADLSAIEELLVQRNNDLSDRAQSLESQLAELMRPFGTDGLRAIAIKSKANRPEPGLARDIEAILTTPFPAAEDRARLWNMSLALEKRLGEIPVRDSEASAESGALRDRSQVVRELAGRRKERLAVLQALAGAKSTADGDAAKLAKTADAPAASAANGEGKSELGAVVRLWAGLAEFSRAVHKSIIDFANQPGTPDGQDRPGWIAPPFTLDLTPNPIREYRERDLNASRAWLADHYRLESLDLRKLVDADGFYANAELETRRKDQARTEPVLELRLPEGSAADLSLSAQNNKAAVTIQILLVSTDDLAAKKVALTAIKPADERFRIVPPPEATFDLVPQKERPVSFQVEWIDAEARDAGPLPKGFIIQARLANQKPFHLLVPVSVISDTTRPQLVLSTDPAQPTEVPFDRLLLRTLPVRQKHFVFVRNRSTSSFNVVVEVVKGTSVIASSDPKPMVVSARSNAVVASFVAPGPAVAPAAAALPPPSAPAVPPGKEASELPEIPSDLKLRLRDAVAVDRIYDEKPLQPIIANPLEYLEVIRAQYVPARLGEPNRLEVALRALPQLTGPACPVTLVVPSDKTIFPGFVEPPKGKLGGNLDPGGEKLDLKAENFRLDPAQPEEGRFQLNIDGLERALWYRTQFRLDGDTQIATLDNTPRVRFRPELDIKPGQPTKLHIHFAVDNAPLDAELSFHLGQVKSGRLVDEITPFKMAPKKRHIGFDPLGPAGALLFEVSVRDWTETREIPPIRGRKKMEAYLTDARTRAVLAKAEDEKVIDDLPPIGNLVEFPEKVAKGTKRLVVKASVKVQEAGIKDVAFIVGPKADFEKPDVAAKIIKGKQIEDDGSAWEGTLSLSPDLTGKVVVTARITNGLGLMSLTSAEAEIDEPAPAPEEVAAKPAPEKPGAIQGKVTENDIAQPGLEVLLIDPKAKENENRVKKRVTTNPDGTYSFAEIKPGMYQVYCIKVPTNRRDLQDVTVPSGETVTKNLDLLIP